MVSVWQKDESFSAFSLYSDILLLNLYAGNTCARSRGQANMPTKKGVFITTSSYSKEARSYVDKLSKKIVLVDGQELARYMIEYNVGVSTKHVYEVKRIDSDYFEE